MIRKTYLILALLIASVLPGHAMHIMEGYLPLGWCVFWYAISAPFVLMSFRAITRLVQGEPRQRIGIALNVAFVFILSALKLPSVTGSSSHLTGTTLGTLYSGVMAMPLIGTIVLLFQALLLAHGGISTLGANVFSLAVAGPLVAYLIYIGIQRIGLSRSLAIFLAAALGSLATYVTTSLQLAIVFPDPMGGISASFIKFMTIFSITQVPLAIVEGAMTLAVMRIIERTDAQANPQTAHPSTAKTLALSLGAVLCLLAPIASSWIDFGEGADDRAGEMVESLAPNHDTTPLVEVFEPSETAEPWLFALQVLLGIALFAWGYHMIRRRKQIIR
ncbi:MAG: energy-coupling factor ABC transporter permease [Porphyromonadaceae bacterium]|nr:energy-coupling factor ABC transporter permease [Porphyromonadaceae bacterium]